jgi:hypothetical protein
MLDDRLSIRQPRTRGISPFPDRWRCNLRSEVMAYTNSGAGTANGTWVFDLNSVYKPWTVTTGLNSISYVFANGQPIGFTSLCNSNLYQNFRVLKACCAIILTPQSVADSVVCTITPSESNSPGLIAATVSQRYAKSTVFASGRPLPSKYGLVNTLRTSQILGCAEKAYQYDLSGNFDGSYNSGPSRGLFWQVLYTTGDNQPLGSALECEFRLAWEVEFFNLTTATVPDS